jgi:outer membrane protein assembly factor BamA
VAPIPVFGISLIFFINTQVVEKVEILGNRHFPKLALMSRAGEPFDPADVDSDRSSITTRYAEAGFLWAVVGAETTRYKSGVKVIFTVNEGRRAPVGGIEIKGTDEPEVLKLVPHSSGFFTKQGVESLVEKILEYYDEAGFPLAQLKPTDFRIVSDSVYYGLDVKPGPEVVVKGLDFAGNRSTKPKVLARLMKLKIPSRYSETRVRAAVERLERTGLFTVTSYQLEEKQGEFLVKLEITERKSNRVYGGLGYSAGPAGGLTGTVLLEFNNFLSTMRQARISYEKTGSYLEFGLSYVEPWIFGWEVSAGIEVSHRTYDTLSSHTELLTFFETPLTPALKLRSDLGWERNVPFTETYWLGFGISLDRLDYPYNPKKGVFYSISSRLGERSPADVSALQSTLDGEVDIPIYKNFVFSSGIHGRDLTTGDSLYSSELFTLGGARSLRGYEEAEFRSSRLGWVSEEIRLLAGRDSRIFVFGDGGGFKSGNQYDWRVGYGAGVRVETGLGMLGIDYGIPGGEKFLEGKIHLSLQGRF